MKNQFRKSKKCCCCFPKFLVINFLLKTAFAVIPVTAILSANQYFIECSKFKNALINTTCLNIQNCLIGYAIIHRLKLNVHKFFENIFLVSINSF